MFKQLRRRIIILNMSLIGAVLLIIFSVVCVNSYSGAKSDFQRGMNETLNRSGKKNVFPRADATDDEGMPEPKVVERMEPSFQISSYIIMELDKDGEIISVTENNASIDGETLGDCAEIIVKENKKGGVISKYGLMYERSDKPSGSGQETTRVIIADNSAVFSKLRGTVVICAVLFVVSMGVIFLISFLLSGLAVRPVRESWEKQKRFVADASHELKTPLTVILANNNIMLSHSPDAEQRKWLESTGEEADHMKKLIDQMLFLAKNDAGDGTAEKTEVDLSDTVEGVSLNFEPVAFEKGVMIDARITPGITVCGNSLQLSQLAHILIDNAVKYARSDSTVEIVLQKKNNSVEFSVHNFGTPISKEDLPHIFDRFYRAEKSRTTKGYGLGLAIAKEITANHGGKITAESSEEKGTTFRVTL